MQQLPVLLLLFPAGPVPKLCADRRDLRLYACIQQISLGDQTDQALAAELIADLNTKVRRLGQSCDVPSDAEARSPSDISRLAVPSFTVAHCMASQGFCVRAAA